MFTPPEAWRLPLMGRCAELGLWSTPYGQDSSVVLRTCLLHLPQRYCNGPESHFFTIPLDKVGAVGPLLAHGSEESLAHGCAKSKRPITDRPHRGLTWENFS